MKKNREKKDLNNTLVNLNRAGLLADLREASEKAKERIAQISSPRVAERMKGLTGLAFLYLLSGREEHAKVALGIVPARITNLRKHKK